MNGLSPSSRAEPTHPRKRELLCARKSENQWEVHGESNYLVYGDL